jgi:hypothetical protein
MKKQPIWESQKKTTNELKVHLHVHYENPIFVLTLIKTTMRHLTTARDGDIGSSFEANSWLRWQTTYNSMLYLGDKKNLNHSVIHEVQKEIWAIRIY